MYTKTLLAMIDKGFTTKIHGAKKNGVRYIKPLIGNEMGDLN